MSSVWEEGPPDRSCRFVLLCLADHADDEGRCWPSVATIARKTCMTERGVRKILRRLEDEGYLETAVGSGRHGCSQYTIKTRNAVPPERGSPRNASAPNDAKTRNASAQNPEHGSPEPSRTINIREPSYTTSNEVDGEAVDFTKALFERGVAFLGKHGVPERTARALVGKWRKEAGEAKTFDAFRAASKCGVTDPVSWITATLKETKGGKQSDWLEAFMRGAQRMDSGAGGDPAGALLPPGRPDATD